MEDNKDSIQESYIPTVDFIEDKNDLVPLAPVKSSESSSAQVGNE